MRIIAGTFRSRQLKSLKGLALRPTSDMLRETLFNILGPRVDGSRFLDLFAGTGAVGIEAISRGAISAVFVENHSAAIRLIRENLALLGIKSEARVVPADVTEALAKLEKESAAARVSGFKGLFYKPLEKQVVLTNPEFKFDFIFLDPPYANEKEYDGTLRALQKSSLIGSSTIVIVEHRKSFELPATYGPFERFRVLRQGDAALTFYKLA